jgi:hypothetical protein
VCFAIDAFLFFAKVTASANVEDGLIALGLVFFAAAFV